MTCHYTQIWVVLLIGHAMKMRSIGTHRKAQYTTATTLTTDTTLITATTLTTVTTLITLTTAATATTLTTDTTLTTLTTATLTTISVPRGPTWHHYLRTFHGVIHELLTQYSMFPDKENQCY